MENEKKLQPEAPEETLPEEVLSEDLARTPYTPRPLWQRIGAWVCLVFFIALILMYYINIMRGGR